MKAGYEGVCKACYCNLAGNLPFAAHQYAGLASGEYLTLTHFDKVLDILCLELRITVLLKVVFKQSVACYGKPENSVR